MEKMPTVAHVIMETTSEPVRPKNIDVMDKNGLFYVSFDAYLQSFNRRNRNNRTYAQRAMQDGLAAPHLQELMGNNTWFGEAGHPHGNEPSRILTIDPKLISHKINDLRYEGNMLIGRVETLDDDSYGRRFTKHILQGMEPAFSLRALAQLTKQGDGSSLVQGRVHVVTYDWVILPSHNDAYRDKRTPIQKIVKDVAMEGNTMLAEDHTLLPVQESQIADFIQMESANVKLISSMFDVAQESMTFSPDLKLAYLKEGSNTFAIKVEDKIQHDIRSYMTKLF